MRARPWTRAASEAGSARSADHRHPVAAGAGDLVGRALDVGRGPGGAHHLPALPAEVLGDGPPQGPHAHDHQGFAHAAQSATGRPRLQRATGRDGATIQPPPMAPSRPNVPRSPRPVPAVLLGLLLAAAPGACQRRDGPHGHPGPAGDPLQRVAAIHGAPGPFAVAGFRIGQRALKELGLPEGSLDIDIRHESPAEVQWSCIADGVQASTGASPGKLNLSMREVPREDLRTVVRRKSTGATITFRLLPSFSQRFVNLPRERLGTAGAEVLALSDDQIFSIERPEAGPP